MIFPVVSYVIYSLKKKNILIFNSHQKLNDYAIIVTAYKNSSNLVYVINSLLKINFPHFIIYVVADACPDFEDTFKNEKVVILKPKEVFANQVKSHFFAIRNFKRDHNILTIIDSDNLVSPDYLSAINKYFNAGYEAVQGVRKAKNLDTHYACIDAVNDIYYLFYDRKILFNIGSSSMLSGSGMAFTVSLYEDCMKHIDSSGAGFDKILQKEIIRKGFRIAFAADAIIYDEKSSNRDQIVKQRARWNNTWFRFFKYGFYLMGQGVKFLSINRFLFGFLLTRPPLFILLIVSFFIGLVNLFISSTAVFLWVIMLFIFVIGFAISLYNSDTDKRIYKSLIHIPAFMFLQVLSLFKAKNANAHSVATEHTYNKDIEQIN